MMLSHMPDHAENARIFPHTSELIRSNPIKSDPERNRLNMHERT